MIKILQIVLLVIGINCVALATNLPTIGNPSTNQVNSGTGSNFILIPISDGDPGITQSVAVSAVSSNTALLQISSVSYNTSNTFAIINVAEFGIASGVVTVTVQAIDADGTTNKSFAVVIDNFYRKGVHLKVYDIVFWQQIVPQNQKPAMDTIITQTALPTNDEFYRPANLTVGAGLACCGYFYNEFSYGFTNAFTGYIKPTISGIYSFYMSSENGGKFFINTIPGGNIFDAGSLATTCSGSSCALSVYLQAGNYYGFHTANWVVYNKTFQLLWTGPGINAYQPIGTPYLFPGLDKIRPSTPTLSLVNKGVAFLTLKWNSSTDNDKVVGYNVYKDGAKVATINDSTFVANSLSPNTLYSFVVTSIDRLGNESLISNIVSTSTYPPDNTAPTPPPIFIFTFIGDMSANVSWTGATDVGSEIIGYYVYLNGSLYNAQYTTNTNMLLKVLTPNTANYVSVVAIDGAFNTSPQSANFNFNTLKFNPLVTSTGVKKARVNIDPTRIARNPGFGLNYGWGNSTFYTSTPSIFKQYIGDLNPGVLRWGDLSANPANYSDYVGTGKSVTIAKFMQLAVDNDSYAQFTCGVHNTTDWMLNSATFTRFMEYIGDPTGQTPGGAQRVAEGYIDPFTTTLKGIIFEFGNEVWGASAHNAEIGANYATYGQWCRSMAAIIKSSPYYDSTKFFMSYSGRSPDPSVSNALNQLLLTGDHHEVNWLSLSGYLGGNLSYDIDIPKPISEALYYKSTTEGMLSNLSGLQSTMDQDMSLTGNSRPFYFYEANLIDPSYNGRLGQAVVMGDYFFSAMKLGVAVPSIFELSGGEWSITDASNGNAKLPFFNVSELMNANTKGNILKSGIQSIEILKNATGLSISGDPVGIHVFNDGSTKYAIALFSRDFDSDYQVQLNLPDNGVYGTKISGNYTAKKYVITGTDFSTRTASTSQSTVPFADSMVVTIPKYSVVLYLFDGPDMGLPLLPLGSNKYKKIDNVKIVNTSGNPNIDLQYGSATFTVAGIPLSVIDKRIGWDIYIPDGSSITFDSTGGNNIKIFGSGLCSGNGVVTITAFSMQDPTVMDQILVSITGQVTDGLVDCNSSLETPQTISFPAIPNKYTTSPGFPIYASASSGLAVTYTIVSGPAIIYNTNSISLAGVSGTVVVRASQSGNTTYAAAPYVDQSFTVSNNSLLDQTISFNTIDAKLTTSDPFSISASASSGLPVTYQVISGPANVSGSTVTLTQQTGIVTIQASQAGNGTYNPTSVLQKFLVTIAGLPGQTITMNQILFKYTSDADFNLTASASSGLPVSFSIVSGPASINGNTVHLLGTPGVLKIEATQAGNSSYNPAVPVSMTFAVLSATLLPNTISFDPISSKRGTDLPFSLSATATSGLPVVFELISGPAYLSGNTVTLFGTDGTVTIRAKQDGNGTYNPAVYVDQTFGVCALPAKPTISASGPTSFCLGLNVTLSTNAASPIWSDGHTSASVSVTTSGNYLVTALGIYGCATVSDVTNVNVQIPPVQNICLVTVDDASGYNQVVFEKAASRANVSKYKITRETDITDKFDALGTLFKDDLPVFLDNTSNPSARSYRYRIELTDVCGNTSTGDIHQTMHLTINKGLTANSWNLIWSEYEGINVLSYKIYRGTSQSNLVFLESVSGNFESYTDNSAPVNATLYYVIEILSDGCNPQARTESYSAARSNVASTSALVSGISTQTSIKVDVFPNPAIGIIHLRSNVEGKVNIYNVIGVKVRSLDYKAIELDIDGLQSGVYMLEFITYNKKVIKKVVVE